ncbi:hypothetical protein M011DRAFT_515527 [Sporormia fimetaria CBS 119925]|uniref:Uncharacterized protein n=1 Tax=Sporormia fimetaria CBS 119925 TaxID=1340428 RepID=A0A6A6VI74_9PLEO|nr:hypothetical protein M011DRAFT_515527 [Sporormia fimetaria CBS 119925]
MGGERQSILEVNVFFIVALHALLGNVDFLETPSPLPITREDALSTAASFLVTQEPHRKALRRSIAHNTTSIGNTVKDTYAKLQAQPTENYTEPTHNRETLLELPPPPTNLHSAPPHPQPLNLSLASSQVPPSPGGLSTQIPVLWRAEGFARRPKDVHHP